MSSGCEPGRGGERGRFGEAGGIEGGAAQGLGQGADPPMEQSWQTGLTGAMTTHLRARAAFTSSSVRSRQSRQPRPRRVTRPAGFMPNPLTRFINCRRVSPQARSPSASPLAANAADHKSVVSRTMPG